MSRFYNLFLAISSSLLLFLSWPVSPLTFLIFVAWIPLLWIESKVKSRKKFFGLVYVTMFIWNVSTTWWIWNASIPGALAAFFANSLIMCLPWIGYKIAKKRLGEKLGFVALIAFWMCFEYIHLLDWGLSWPWLTLGNSFATHPDWVQWYEYTGTSGGTLWILLSNVILFSLFKEYQLNGRSRRYFLTLAGWAILIVLPLFIHGHSNYEGTSDAPGQNIVIVQPNIDPYEKVSSATGSFEAQLQTLISTSESEIDDNTALVIWPETALYTERGIDEANLKDNFFLNPFWAFLKRHPNISLFTGVESYREFDHKTKYTVEFSGKYFEAYNGSMLIDSAGPAGFYHKSMLVPGVETLPWFLKFLSKWFDKFGGTTGGYAKQKERTVLNEKHGYKIAPAICYESVYGEFMSRYIRNGANLICIITNDGWWKKTPGHKQHMNYARLRAIESRTWVARSANTGISCFISPDGNVINARPYDTKTAIKLAVPVNDHAKTFYVRFGDVLSKLMVVLSVGLLVWVVVLKIRKKVNY